MLSDSTLSMAIEFCSYLSTIRDYYATKDSQSQVLNDMFKLKIEIVNKRRLQAYSVSQVVQRDFDILLGQYLQVLHCFEQDEQEESTTNTGTTYYCQTGKLGDGIENPDESAGDEGKTAVETATPGDGNGIRKCPGPSLKPACGVVTVPTKRIEWKLKEDFLYPFYKRAHLNRRILLSKSRNYHPFGFSIPEIEFCRESWGCERIIEESRGRRRSKRWWKKKGSDCEIIKA